MLEQLKLTDIENIWGGSKNNQNPGERSFYFDETKGMPVASNATWCNSDAYYFFESNATRLQQNLDDIIELSQEHGAQILCLSFRDPNTGAIAALSVLKKK